MIINCPTLSITLLLSLSLSLSNCRPCKKVKKKIQNELTDQRGLLCGRKAFSNCHQKDGHREKSGDTKGHLMRNNTGSRNNIKSPNFGMHHYFQATFSPDSDGT